MIVHDTCGESGIAISETNQIVKWAKKNVEEPLIGEEWLVYLKIVYEAANYTYAGLHSLLRVERGVMRRSIKHKNLMFGIIM